MNELLLSNTANEYSYSSESMIVNIDTELIQQQAKTSINSADTATTIPPYNESSQQLQYAPYSAYTFQPLSVEFTPAVPAYSQALPRLGYFDSTSNTGSVAISSTPSVTTTYNKQPTSPASISSSSSPSTPPPPSHAANLPFEATVGNIGDRNNACISATGTLSANEVLGATAFSNTPSTVTCAPTTSFPESPNSAGFTTLTSESNPQQQLPHSDAVSKELSPSITYSAPNVSRGINTSLGTNPAGGNDMTVVVAAAAPHFASSTTARVKEMISRANSIPLEFFHTEFLEYSKETYEKKLESKRNKRKRPTPSQQEDGHSQRFKDSEFDSFIDSNDHSNEKADEGFEQAMKRKRSDITASDMSDANSLKKDATLVEDDYFLFAESADDNEVKHQNSGKLSDGSNGASNAEIRRQIHIQSEQKRRAQIKDGFDELRKHLPGCNNKKMSKAALLTRTVQQLQHLKGMQNELLSEVERLLQENEALKKFQHGILQRQALDKSYTF